MYQASQVLFYRINACLRLLHTRSSPPFISANNTPSMTSSQRSQGDDGEREESFEFSESQGAARAKMATAAAKKSKELLMEVSYEV